MEGKKLLFYFIEALSWISLIGAFIGLAYFVQDILEDFLSKKTNDRVFSKRVTSYRHPYITLCFEPQVNISKLKKYNLTLVDLSHMKLGKPLTTLSENIDTFIEDVRFKIGRDFTLDFSLPGSESKVLYAHFDKLKSPNTSLIELEELPLIMYGTCTIIKISSGVIAVPQMQNIFNLNIISKDKDNLPSINAYFTSKENIHGAVWQQWLEGEIFTLNIDPQLKRDYSANLKQLIRRKLPEKSFCNQDSSYYKCLEEK